MATSKHSSCLMVSFKSSFGCAEWPLRAFLQQNVHHDESVSSQKPMSLAKKVEVTLGGQRSNMGIMQNRFSLYGI